MAAFRALLIGVGEYEDERISGLPFVSADLADLGKALTARGYTVESVDGPNLGRTQLGGRVQRFLNQARSDDRLLIVLSGHGVHIDGSDYLVPSDTELDYDPLPETLVEIGWRKQIENCNAASVLIVVDACRQGLELGTKAIGTVTDWTRGKIARASRRQVAYLYACSPGEFARYVNNENEAFSFFSRALQDVAADAAGPTSLGNVIGAVQDRLNELTGQRNKPRQNVLASRLDGLDSFPMFPASRSADEAGGENDPWVKRAREHRAWSLVVGRPGAEAVQAATVALVSGLSRARRRAADALVDDPWHDEGYALRVADPMEFLLSADGYIAPEPPLSPAEAALLVATPFVKDAWWIVEAQSALGELDTDRWWDESDGEQPGQIAVFSRAYPRLRRRAQSARAKGDVTATSAIGWWLARRWLDRELRSAHGQGAAELDRLTKPTLAYARSAGDRDPLARRLIDEVFAAERLARLVQSTDADPGFVGRGDAPGALADWALLCSTTAHEQPLRESLVAYLLMLASRLAIDTARLGEILVDHIGIADSVDLGELRITVAAASWQPMGASRVLHAACTHPAVEIALSAHAEHVSSLLAAIHAAASVGGGGDRLGLSGLPTRAGANGVGPAETDGQRAYDSAGVRFRLADDRIQELLMGEQLYRDRALAIRELYQNALDACRYRRARTEYLRQTTRVAPNWRGEISFRQGADEDGRAYIECSDNGIGMGVRELSELFAQAGARFTDLPEYVVESAQWARLEQPVRLFPNSRFGIGVLSYFMLADEIVVETCRLDRLGRPGQRLRVTIAGPGALFRIRTVEEHGADAGTTVRLYLHPSAQPPSCVEVLRQLLWVAEFDTSAHHEDQSQHWSPGELSEAAPVGRDEEFTTQAVRTVTKIVPAFPGTAWWCGGEGALLADGLWAGKTFFGAVVNLTGKQAPLLSVDRSAMLDFNRSYVEDTLHAAAPVLAEQPQPVKDGFSDSSELPGYRWLCELAESEPVIADAILDALQRKEGLCWHLRGQRIRIARFGCFPADYSNGALPFVSRDLLRQQSDFDYGIGAWRCSAYIASLDTAGDAPTPTPDEQTLSVLPARPSDAVLLAGIPRGATDVSRTHVAAVAAILGWTRDEVSARLRTFGYTAPQIDADEALASLTPDDLPLISTVANSYGPWLDESAPVTLTHLVRAAFARQSDIPQAAARLRALGFSAPDTAALPRSPINYDDLKLVSIDIDGQHPWLDSDRAVSVYHAIRASRELHWSVEAVVARLAARGFDVSAVAQLREGPVLDEVATVLQSDLYATNWLIPDRIGTPGHLLISAAQLGTGTAQVAEKLSGLGLPVSEAAANMRHSDPVGDDTEMLWTIGGTDLIHTEVSFGQILLAAEEADRSAAEVADRLTELGLDCADISGLSGRTPDPDDYQLIRYIRTAAPATSGDTVSPLAIAQAATYLRWSIEKTAGRLTTLGFAVPSADELPASNPLDQYVFKYSPFGLPFKGGTPVPRQFVLEAAQRARTSAHSMAWRLSVLGCDIPDPETYPDTTVDPDDIKLLSSVPKVGAVDLTGSRAHILLTAAAKHLPVDVVAARLAAFGYHVADVSDPDTFLARTPTAIAAEDRWPQDSGQRAE